MAAAATPKKPRLYLVEVDMPPFLPQAKPIYPDNADFSKQLYLLGDTIGKGIGDYRNQQRLLEIGNAAKGGNYAAARDAAFGSGRVDLGIKFQDSLDTKQARSEDVAFRDKKFEHDKSSTDRAFGLKEREFAFEQSYKNQMLGLKRLESEFKAQGGYKDIKERSEVEGGLRKEFNNLSKDFINVRDAYGRIQAAAKDPSPAGDIALIFNYMKMLDPGSTVREGEFATAQNATGIPEQIKNMYNKAMEGTRLGDTQRNDFVGRAGKLFTTQEGGHKKLVEQYTGIGNRLGVDIRNVAPDHGAPGAGTVDWKTYFGGQK
jgi:hypothetical protein